MLHDRHDGFSPEEIFFYFAVLAPLSRPMLASGRTIQTVPRPPQSFISFNLFSFSTGLISLFILLLPFLSSLVFLFLVPPGLF